MSTTREQEMNKGGGNSGFVFPTSAEISPQEFARAIRAGEPLQVMDVRAPERVARGRIETIPSHRFHNIRGSELMHYKDVPSTGLDPELPVVAVCGRGLDSKILAFHLGRLGLDAMSLAGGMSAWMRLTVPIELDVPQGLDRLVQFDRIGKGCLGYLLVSGDEAIVVDPPLHFYPYLETLGETAANIVGVADTHAHADYVSGASAIARAFGVPYYLARCRCCLPLRWHAGKIGVRSHLGWRGHRVWSRQGRRGTHPGPHGRKRHFLGGGAGCPNRGLPFRRTPSVGPTWGEKRRNGQHSSGIRWLGPFGIGTMVSLSTLPTTLRRGKEGWEGAVGIPFGTLLQENELLKIQDPDVFLHHILSQKAPFPDAYKKIKAINVGLAPAVETEVEELEVGRNECALGGGR